MSDSTEKTIFLNALDLESDERREEYLRSACGGDSHLRASVDALLGAHDLDENPLDSPVAVAGMELDAAQIAGSEATVDSPAIDQVGDIGKTIGSYRLMEQIGEGGFGLVYVAQQEKPVRRKVALKIIKPGTGSSEVLARFDAERQAVAMMDHPNIAQVFDAGVTDDARPYFVMELVRGVPITAFCKEGGLGLRERLEIFQDVCAATHHAHQKGVIHRDLKPSNVLVTLHDARPVAKVIDFGVAKAMGQSLTDQTIYTRLYSMVGTPLYMSPEQASMSGLDVDTRSDIYSLGVMLYELLTGTTPFLRERLDTVGYDEMRRIIREEEPPKPSSRLTTVDKQRMETVGQSRGAPNSRQAAVSRTALDRIPNDLDWIVMKAMDKDRSRRYESAAAMAADLRRFLLQEPIEARPPSRIYRLSKFAGRNRVGLMTGGLVAVALLVGTAMSLYQASRAIDERNKKDVALQEAIAARNDANEARDEVQQFTERLKRANALLGEARTHEELEQVDAAAAIYDEAVELVPNYYLVWVRRAQLRLRQKQWEKAAADFSNAMYLDAPVDAGEWQGVPALFVMTGRSDDCQQICSMLLKPTRENDQAMGWNAIRACLVGNHQGVDPEWLAMRADELLAAEPMNRPWERDGGRGPGPGRRPEGPRGGPGSMGPGPRGPGSPGRGGPNPGGPGPSGPGGPESFEGMSGRGRMHFLPRNVQQYLAGWAHLRANHNDRAVELLDAASEDGRWHADYLIDGLKAIAQYQAGRTELAEEFLRRSNEEFQRFENADESTTVGMRYWVDFVEGVVTNREANRLIKGDDFKTSE